MTTKTPTEPMTLGDDEKLESSSQSATDVQQEDDADTPETARNLLGDIEREAVRQQVSGSSLDWDGPDDPDNPLNWPAFKRNSQVLVIALYALLANLTATMFAPGVQGVMEEFGVTDKIIASMAVSIYILGFAFGPLIFAPLSERYGRLPIYAITGALYIAFLLGCAFATNMGMFIAFRLFSGAASASSISLSGGTLADVIRREQRAKWMGLFVLGPLLGPVIGPVAGGFVAENLDWRWEFRIILIACGVVAILGIIFIRETYAPVLLRRRALRRRKERGEAAAPVPPTLGNPAMLMVRTITRPLRLLVFSPIVLFLSLYAAFAFGLLFLLFTSVAIVFKGQYGFTTGTSGLSYIGLGVGMLSSLGLQIRFGDAIMASRARKTGHAKPEDRLMITAYFAPTLPAGLFWYGWSVDKQTHWIVPILGTVLIGIGIVSVMMPQMIYLIEIFGAAAGASALAANTVLRCITGAFLPLAGDSMFRNLGLGWANSLLAFLGIALLPIPWILGIYGEKIRLNSKFKL